MKRGVSGATVILLVVLELVLALSKQRAFTLVIAGIAVTLILLGLRSGLQSDDDERDARPDLAQAPTEALDRWHSRTETMISWADGSRGDWDKHLRPILAREFQMSTGHRLSKDRAALDASGRMLFGRELWQWVDPMAMSYARRDEAGPGRAALADILERLERI